MTKHAAAKTSHAEGLTRWHAAGQFSAKAGLGLSRVCNYLQRALCCSSWLSPKRKGHAITSTYLLIQSSARIKKSLWSWCSSLKMEHCSSVTDMDVRSLALLQQVKRTPFSLRQIWNIGRREMIALFTPCALYTLGRLWNRHNFAITMHTENYSISQENSYWKVVTPAWIIRLLTCVFAVKPVLSAGVFSYSKDYGYAGLTQCHKRWKCCAEKNCKFIFCL